MIAVQKSLLISNLKIVVRMEPVFLLIDQCKPFPMAELKILMTVCQNVLEKLNVLVSKKIEIVLNVLKLVKTIQIMEMNFGKFLELNALAMLHLMSLNRLGKCILFVVGVKILVLIEMKVLVNLKLEALVIVEIKVLKVDNLKMMATVQRKLGQVDLNLYLLFQFFEGVLEKTSVSFLHLCYLLPVYHPL